jgi:hypothetical protein
VVHAPERQLPAYEWAFGDVNPPVHAWAMARLQIDRRQRRAGRLRVRAIFHKLLLNFTWWVNCKDADGRNVPGRVPGPRQHRRSTAARPPDRWPHQPGRRHRLMGMYTLNLRPSELAGQNPAYEDIATKFFEHSCTSPRR